MECRARSSFPICSGVILLTSCSVGILSAQNSEDSGRSNSWSSVRESQFSGTVNPIKISVSYREADGRTVETQSLERMGTDGHYEPYLDIEKETARVDTDTMRTVERSYARDVNGGRQLVQMTEGQSQTLADGCVKAVRTTSDPDVNGTFQPVQKEVEITKQISHDVKQTTTSDFVLDAGELTESFRTEQRQVRRGHTVESRKTNLVRDINARWQTREVRQGISTEDGTQRFEEENILRPDSSGKMELVQRTTKKETTLADGDKQTITEIYSIDLPGVARDEKLHLVDRLTAVVKLGQNGQLSMQVKVENPNPGSPADGMRVTTQSVDVIAHRTDGIAHETNSVNGIDLNGNMGVVRVDIGTSGDPEQ